MKGTNLPPQPPPPFPSIFGFGYDPASSSAFGKLAPRQLVPTEYGARAYFM